ncbi:hypothetical protein CEXT_289261 [Caerostris extrusa]|uniref:Uncharacterized protein n=1 Tax=Caerostris extrusa TaxID=172846 RepID=A0AAV4RN41_CAEEX|nr:hypothetical protein CEXT_289261 [Caerostris extrusa]
MAASFSRNFSGSGIKRNFPTTDGFRAPDHPPCLRDISGKNLRVLAWAQVTTFYIFWCCAFYVVYLWATNGPPIISFRKDFMATCPTFGCCSRKTRKLDSARCFTLYDQVSSLLKSTTTS